MNGITDIILLQERQININKTKQMLSRSQHYPVTTNTLSKNQNNLNKDNQYLYRKAFSRNSSPKLKYGQSDNPLNCEYRAQHNKWGDLRSKIKMMKLDNITVRTYKNQYNQQQLNSDKIKTPSPNSFIVNHSDQEMNLNCRFNSVKITKQNQHKKNQSYELTQNSQTKELLMCYTQSASKKTQKQSAGTKRIFHSKTNPQQSPNKINPNTQLIYLYRKRTRQRIMTANQSSEKINNPESLQRKYKQRMVHTPKPDEPFINDLQKISSVTQKDIQSRVIIRKKSQIGHNNLNIKAWEASIVRRSTILFLCDEIKRNQLEGKDLESEAVLSKKQYRLILGPGQSAKYSQKFQIDDIPRLASVLLDYLIIDYYHGKLKICKEAILNRQNSNEFIRNKDEILKQLEKSPYIWVGGHANIKRKNIRPRTKPDPFHSKQFQALCNVNDKESDQSQISQQDQKPMNQQQVNSQSKQNAIQQIQQVQSSHFNVSKNISEEIVSYQATKRNTIDIKNENQVSQVLQSHQPTQKIDESQNYNISQNISKNVSESMKINNQQQSHQIEQQKISNHEEIIRQQPIKQPQQPIKQPQQPQDNAESQQ